MMGDHLASLFKTRSAKTVKQDVLRSRGRGLRGFRSLDAIRESLQGVDDDEDDSVSIDERLPRTCRHTNEVAGLEHPSKFSSHARATPSARDCQDLL